MSRCCFCLKPKPIRVKVETYSIYSGWFSRNYCWPCFKKLRGLFGPSARFIYRDELLDWRRCGF
jgi:hypothetical protein